MRRRALAMRGADAYLAARRDPQQIVRDDDQSATRKEELPLTRWVARSVGGSFGPGCGAVTVSNLG